MTIDFITRKLKRNIISILKTKNMSIETLARYIGVDFDPFLAMLNNGIPTKQLNDIMAVLCISYDDLLEPRSIGNGYRPNPKNFTQVPIIPEDLFFGDITPTDFLSFKSNDYLLIDVESKDNIAAIQIENSRLLFLGDTPRPRFAIITPGHSKSENNFFISPSEKIFFTDHAASTINSDYIHIGILDSILFGTKEEIEDRADMLKTFFEQ
ncbi:MAG: hypothetical protein KIT27_10280 [Legionellales bacterium]|nr:hypothetical protein [Legionellales bacterium]